MIEWLKYKWRWERRELIIDTMLTLVLGPLAVMVLVIGYDALWHMMWKALS